MQKVLIIASALLLSGCGRGSYNPVAMDSAFDSYVLDYDTEAVRYGQQPVAGKLSITFASLPVGGEAGSCNTGTLNSHANITIDRFQWAQMLESEKLALIYHELGHCVLGQQQHRANSVMAASVLPGTRFLEHKEQYVSELFNH